MSSSSGEVFGTAEIRPLRPRQDQLPERLPQQYLGLRCRAVAYSGRRCNHRQPGSSGNPNAAIGAGANAGGAQISSANH